MGVSRAGVGAALTTAAGTVTLLLLTSASGAGQTSGVIEGRVTTTVVATTAQRPVTTDYEICGRFVPDDSLVVDASGGVAHAVVTVTGLPALESDELLMVTNSACRFAPHVQVARPGEIGITSEDDTLHTTHAYMADEQSLFNVATPIPGLVIRRAIAAEGIVRLACDTHTWMRGFVVVTDDRSVVTATDGTFRIEGVPPGTYDLRIWHEQLQSAPQQVTVSAGATSTVPVVLTGSPAAPQVER